MDKNKIQTSDKIHINIVYLAIHKIELEHK